VDRRVGERSGHGEVLDDQIPVVCFLVDVLRVALEVAVAIDRRTDLQGSAPDVLPRIGGAPVPQAMVRWTSVSPLACTPMKTG
jgi:hypothetical protein